MAVAAPESWARRTEPLQTGFGLGPSAPEGRPGERRPWRTAEVLSLASGVRVLRIRQLRNIRAATVDLRPFTVLVGPNGAGKSNILAALQFVAAAMVLPLDQAIRSVGGIATLRRRSAKGQPPLFGVSVECDIADVATRIWMPLEGSCRLRGISCGPVVTLP